MIPSSLLWQLQYVWCTTKKQMQICSLKWSVLNKMPEITQIVYHDALLKTHNSFMHLRGRCTHVYIMVDNNSYLGGECRDYVEDSQNSMFFNMNIGIVGDFLVIFLAWWWCDNEECMFAYAIRRYIHITFGLQIKSLLYISNSALLILTVYTCPIQTLLIIFPDSPFRWSFFTR